MASTVGSFPSRAETSSATRKKCSRRVYRARSHPAAGFLKSNAHGSIPVYCTSDRIISLRPVASALINLPSVPCSSPLLKWTSTVAIYRHQDYRGWTQRPVKSRPASVNPLASFVSSGEERHHRRCRASASPTVHRRNSNASG